MNRKIMILMVAVVATVLPAVAVADVMITGSVSVQGSNIAPFYIAQGPNYAAANSAGVLTWTPTQTGSDASMGTLDLEGTANQTVEMVNVLMFNYTGNVAGTFYFNGTNSFTGLEIASSPSPMTLSGASWNAIPSGTFAYTMSVTGPISMYIGFELPPGTYSDSSLSVTITFVAS